MQCDSGAAGNGLIDRSPCRPDDQHLAGLDVAHVGRADQIERARFRRHRPGIAETAERQRAEAVRIADGDQAVLGDQRERERAGQLRDRLDDRVLDRSGLRPRIEMEHDFGVAVGLEDRSGAHQPLADFVRVDDVAVVADADLAVHAIDQDRLRVRELALAGGRIARVADRDRAGQRRERGLVEDLVDVAHALHDPHALAVGRRDAGALLAAMLQRVEPEIGQLRRFRVSVDSEHPAFILELVEHKRLQLSALGLQPCLP